MSRISRSRRKNRGYAALGRLRGRKLYLKRLPYRSSRRKFRRR